MTDRDQQPVVEQYREFLRGLPKRDRWNHLAQIIVTRRQALVQAKADLDYAQAMLIEEMQEDQAQDAVTADYQVHLKSQSTYTYDDEGLSELQGYLEPEEYEQAVQTITSLKWSKVALNKLHKRGGILAKIIDGGVQEISRRTDVEVKPRG